MSDKDKSTSNKDDNNIASENTPAENDIALKKAAEEEDAEDNEPEIWEGMDPNDDNGKRAANNKQTITGGTGGRPKK